MHSNYLYHEQRYLPGEPGTKTDVRAVMPHPHWLLWGQRLLKFARATTLEAEAFSDYLVKGLSTPSDLMLANEQEELQVSGIGDSFLTVPGTYELAVSLPEGDVHNVRLIRNDANRLSGFEIGPFKAPTIREALGLGEIVASNLERAASLANIPLRFASIRAERPDGMEQRESFILPYPIVDLPVWTTTPYPAAATLVATLAEGRRSTSIFYRALVFFKIIETFIEKIQPSLTNLFHQHMLQLEALDLRLPAEPFTVISPVLIGMPYTQYRKQVQNRIRNVIGHLDPDSPIVPFDINAEAEVRTASIVLHFIATEIINHVERSLTRLAESHPDAAKAFTYGGIDKRRKRGKKKT